MNFTFVALLLFSLTANVRGSFSIDTKNDELVYHANYQDLAQENLSMLRFEPVDEFAKTEQQELDYAAQSFWGRLYVDRFPGRVGFQYFRAHFGLAPPMENVIFRLASPSNLCEKDERLALYNKTGLGQDIILVAWRGDCSFTDKALAAHESGADGVLYVNNVDGNLHPSGPGFQENEVDITAAMIDKHDGQRLIDALEHVDYMEGRYVPMTCISSLSTKNPNSCQPTRSKDRYALDMLNFTGQVTWSPFGEEEESFDYIQADFGGTIRDGDSYSFAYISPRDYCDPDVVRAEKADFVEKALLVLRGTCDFATKAENLYNNGAKLMVLMNNEDALFPLGRNYRTSMVRITAITITKTSGERLASLIMNGDPSIKKEVSLFTSGSNEISKIIDAIPHGLLRTN